MDFASLMKAQISTSKPSNSDRAGEQKYLKRSEVEARRQAEYLREQEALERARIERLEKKRKRDEEEAVRNAQRDAKRKRLAEESRKLAEAEAEAEEAARRKRLGLPDLGKKGTEGPDGASLGDGEDDVPEEELLAKLKDLGEPRILFAETHLQRLRRYRKLAQAVTAPKLSTGPIPTTLKLLPEAEMKVPSSVPSDAATRTYLHRQLASYFTLVLTEWQTALAQRSTAVKESFAGKQAYNSFLAARDNLRLLFSQLQSHTISPTLLGPIVEIVDLAQQKRYVHANDAYLRLAIGKAAWPIGVTMVGIHERSAREKLHETGEGGKEAHILADEGTRKMLQGIKRCLSFAQTRWPPEDVGQLMG